MHDTSTENSMVLTREQKDAALETVLLSQTFARADQLKSFLQYICKMEMAGCGHQLSEYLIATEALGRPANYSPVDDSSVRTRAFALRKKLQEFYEREHPEATLRIELQKGSYCPHFVMRPSGMQTSNGIHTEPLAPALAETPKVAEVKTPGETKPRTGVQGRWWLPFCAGALVSALLGVIFYFGFRTKPAASLISSQPTPILSEAWGPLLKPGTEVLLSVANPPAFSVLPGPVSLSEEQTPLIGERPLPQQFYQLFSSRYPNVDTLRLTVTSNATYWGDVLAALTAFKTMTTAGVAPQLLPEMVTAMPALRRRNVVLIGAPAYSPAVARFLEKCPLRVNYLDSIVGSDNEQSPVMRYALKRDHRQRLTQVYGLITVFPGESAANQPTRVLIFSGVNSAGAQAAAEFYSSPQHLLNLKSEFQKAGHAAFPSAYQVVVRAETDDSILLNFNYEAFRIISLPASQ